MTPVKVGVVGLGAWGWNVARCVHEIPGFELVACSDLNLNRRDMAERSWGVKTVNDLDEMLAAFPDIQGIVLATPACTHYQLAKQCLLAGKDVFVEKPFTLDVHHAEELVRIADEGQRVLMVGHLMEYHPAVNEIRNLIRSGELGDIYYIYTQRVNLGRIRGDENALWSFAPHDISQILYMLGDSPIDVSARGQSFIQSGIEDVVFLSLFFQNRVMAHVHISWLDPHKVRSTTVVGSKKMVVFDDAASSEKLRIYDSCAQPNMPLSFGEAIQVRFGEIRIPRISNAEPLRLECEHFLECVTKRLQPRSDGQDGLRVVNILDAAQQSLDRDGVPVSLVTGKPSTPHRIDPMRRIWTAPSASPIRPALAN